MILAPDPPNKPTCPIWDGLKKTSFQHPSPAQNVLAEGSPFYSSRAGGPFRLMPSGAALLDFESVGDERKSLPDRQKANLGYSIYKHNLENHLFDELSNEVLQEPQLFLKWMDDHQDRVLELDKDWVEGRLQSKTSAEDRMLMFLRELIRSDDAGVPPDEELLRAAGGCRSGTDLQEMWRYSVEQGWTGSNKRGSEGTSPHQINVPARMYVDQRTRELDQESQGFVAMSFDPDLTHVYKDGIKPAIKAAGYNARRIDDKAFTGPVVDEMLAEIRKSKFVVADFTSCEKCKHIGAPGGVYWEAGFAHGLDIPVFLTCREDRTKAIHFDIDHIKRLQWKTPEDLCKQLKNSIEAVLGRGPLDPSDDQPRQHFRRMPIRRTENGRS